MPAGSVWLLYREETGGKMDGSREMKGAVATLEEGEDHGFDREEVTWDQKLDVLTG